MLENLSDVFPLARLGYAPALPILVAAGIDGGDHLDPVDGVVATPAWAPQNDRREMDLGQGPSMVRRRPGFGRNARAEVSAGP
jgi:hypothetical protein